MKKIIRLLKHRKKKRARKKIDRLSKYERWYCRYRFNIFQKLNFKQNKVLESFEFALVIEKTVNLNLLELHNTADTNNDPVLADFIEGEF